MTMNLPRVPSGPRTRRGFGASLVIARTLALGLVALVLQGCDAKLSDSFVPITGVGGGGGGGEAELTASDIDGDWNVSYATTATTCEASLPPFDVEAQLSTMGTGSSVTLDVLFPDAPVPIRGTIELTDGAFTGTTGPVDIGGGFFATESWQADFAIQGDGVVFSGTSHVDVEDDGGTPVCGRNFTVDGVRLAF